MAGEVMAAYTRTSWAQALLQRLGYPTTDQNVAAIVAWETAEGGHWENTAQYNPLDTTQTMPGSSPMNSVGVQAYTSWGQGLDATVKTLTNGMYSGVLSALQQGNSSTGVAKAVGASPWGSNGSLIEQILGFGTGDTTTPSSDSGLTAGATSTSSSGGSSSKLNINPLDGFGIPAAISSSVGKDALRVVIEGVLILGGASLVVVGLYRAVQPAVQKVASVAGDATKATAAAAAV